MRVTLVTEGTYPLTDGGVSTWCDLLIRGLPHVTFDIVALSGVGTEPSRWDAPSNAGVLLQHGVWGRPPSWRRRRRAASFVNPLQRELHYFWRSVLNPFPDAQSAGLRASLRRLIAMDDETDIAACLANADSSRALAQAWNEFAQDQKLPKMSVADAVAVASIVDRTLALLSLRPPESDLVHATANGPCGLIGLAVKWRHDTPLILTEHGIYLREQYIALRRSALNWVQRRAVATFTRAVSRIVLQEADAIFPVSDFNGGWAVQLGAAPTRVHTIRNGVDGSAYRLIRTEPEEPTIVFVGRIDPLKDLDTLIRAHALVVKALPRTQLRIFGPVPAGNENYAAGLRALVGELRTDRLVTFEGACDGREALTAGSLIALTSVSEGLPFTLIEAMMCGRATVSTDVGGVRECIDAEQRVGRVVPPKQPQAFADACIPLLSFASRRHRMGDLAAMWARERFDIEEFTTAYALAYENVAPLRSRPYIAEESA